MKKLIIWLFMIVLLFPSYCYADTENSKATGKVVLNFTGDLILGGDFGASSMLDLSKKKSSSYFLEGVSEYFKNDDLTICNLETPFTKQKDYTKGKIYTYKADPKLVDVLKNGGVDAVSVTTNHMQDYKQDGFDESISVLEKSGIAYFGTNIWENSSPEIGSVYVDMYYEKEINGIKVGFLGFTGFNRNSKGYKSELKKRIESLHKTVDFVAVSMHWGGQNERILMPYQVELGKYIIDCGADVVIGHHPHVLQRVDTYKGKKIFYSLGNFIFDRINNPSDRLSAIVNLTLTKDNERVYADYKIIPVYYNGTKTRAYQPYEITDKKIRKNVFSIMAVK